MNTLALLASTGVDNLDVTDQILIAALIASLRDKKQTFSRKELLGSDFSPTNDLSLRAVDQLISAGLVRVKEKSKELQSNYELKIPNNEQTLKKLISSIKSDNERNHDRLKLFIFEVLSAECIEYIVTEMKKRNLSIKSDSRPPERLFNLLNNHTCAEVHMLLWQAMQHLNDSDFRILIATASHAEIINQVVNEAYQHHERYQHFKKSIRGFKRRADYRKSVITKILFSQYLDIGQEYFTTLF